MLRALRPLAAEPGPRKDRSAPRQPQHIIPQKGQKRRGVRGTTWLYRILVVVLLRRFMHESDGFDLSGRSFAGAPPLTGPGAFVPGDRGPMPYYFSGTDCRASGSVSGPIGVPEDHGELWIGGTLVKTWSRIPGTAPQTFTLSAIFDSTHFPSGSMVSVKIKGD